MTLITTSLLSLVSTAVKMLAGLAISKALAVYVGPAGLALVGQFQNLIQVLLTAAKGAIDAGLTKYTAEYGRDPALLAPLFGTALRIGLACSAVVGATLVLASTFVSRHFLHSESHSWVVTLFGFTLVLFVLNSLLLAVLNGLHEIRSYVAINIFQSVVSLLLTVGLIATLALDGALIALVTNQSLVLVVALWTLRRHPMLRREHWAARFDAVQARKLARFATMTITSSVAAPVTTMLVRDHIVRTIGLSEAGYWQAAWYVSQLYLSVLTTSLAIYYLPKLSAITDMAELRVELRRGYALVVPLTGAIACCVWLARKLIVELVFTPQFEPMLRLFGWMLVGDIVKMASWMLSYLVLAKAMTRTFISTEIAFSALFVLLCMALTPRFGLQGVVIAHAANYLLYLLALALATRPLWRG